MGKLHFHAGLVNERGGDHENDQQNQNDVGKWGDIDFYH
jgi:hypothetical protein